MKFKKMQITEIACNILGNKLASYQDYIDR